MLYFDAALAHFVIVDPVLADLLQTVLANSDKTLINPEKSPPSTYAFHLYSSIISQQISTKAASKILERFLELVGDPHDLLTF